MAYCTQQNLVDRFGLQEMIQLTDIDNLGVINTLVLNQAIADADAVINGYLSGRYSLPLASPPAVLTRMACDIVRYYLNDDNVTDQVKRRFDEAIKLLEQVAKGIISLGLDSQGETVAQTSQIEINSQPSVFGRDSNY